MAFTETATPHKKEGLLRVIRATGHSLEGLASAFKHESAFRQEAVLAAVLIPLAALLPVGLMGACLMVLSVFLVLIVELLNSAVEWVVDYISLEKHPFAKRAKDMASGAVFLSLMNVAVIWSLVIAYNWREISAVIR